MFFYLKNGLVSSVINYRDGKDFLIINSDKIHAKIGNLEITIDRENVKVPKRDVEDPYHEHGNHIWIKP